MPDEERVDPEPLQRAIDAAARERERIAERDYVNGQLEVLRERIAGLDRLIDKMFNEKEKALDAALAAQKEAVSKAEENSEKWRSSANEWRGAMSDRDRELPSRREVDTALNAVETRIAALEKTSDLRMGQSAGVKLSMGSLVGAVTTTAAFVTIVIIVANILTSK